MSPSRALVWETLLQSAAPETLAGLVTSTGLHANTLRDHLDALVADGLVRRRREEPKGRGRPAWLYEATNVEPASGRTEYAGLAATLAAAIHRTSPNPREEAVAAGTEWGRELARDSGPPATHTRSAARRKVVEMLGEIGFAPVTDARATVAHLTRCPLLDAAHRYPDVVCGVHLGIVRGALEEYDADPSRTDLLPFSEPGACRLDLLTPLPKEPA